MYYIKLWLLLCVNEKRHFLITLQRKNNIVKINILKTIFHGSKKKCTYFSFSTQFRVNVLKELE